jgi:5-methylcytosine-specific restriction endonuclease McrA
MQKHVANYLKHFKLGEQDTWFCEGCMKERPINNGLQIHHIIYRSHGGSDEVENNICLCVKHHDQAHQEKLSKGELTTIHRYFLAGNRKAMIK